MTNTAAPAHDTPRDWLIACLGTAELVGNAEGAGHARALLGALDETDVAVEARATAALVKVQGMLNERERLARLAWIAVQHSARGGRWEAARARYTEAARALGDVNAILADL